MYYFSKISNTHCFHRAHKLLKIVSSSFFDTRNISKSCIRFLQNNVIPPCVSAAQHLDRVAVRDAWGEHSYGDTLRKSQILAQKIHRLTTTVIEDDARQQKRQHEQQRIAMLCPNDFSYVVAQWATWLSGHVSVPLHRHHPSTFLSYFLRDSQAAVVVVTPGLRDKLDEALASGVESRPEVLVLDDKLLFADHGPPETSAPLVPPSFYNRASALILYTSGTSGPPKGVVTTHANIKANVQNMVAAWDWSKHDVLLHCLPLHHTHGVLNALLCPLDVGAQVVMMCKFNAAEVWEKLLTTDLKKRITVFMGVPTMYAKLIEEFENKFQHSRNAADFIKAFCEQKIRLMVSGSAALPKSVYSRWEEITGHKLLERYGMTEIGMALTNPLVGERRPGFVGNPFPNTQVRLVQKNAYSPLSYDVIAEGTSKQVSVTPGKANENGELLVKGPTVFKEYWNKPVATKEAFTKDGWFVTGDTVAYVDGMFKIQGRSSVDIIKSGGYKISALDVEHHLLTHPDVRECIVVGVADIVWGQKIAAVVVRRTEDSDLTLSALQQWCRERMAPYMVPSILKVVEEIPKNAMGKVNKKELANQLFG